MATNDERQARLLDPGKAGENAKVDPGQGAGVEPAGTPSVHHRRMLQFYGTTRGQTCGGCLRLWQLHYENAPYKCSAMTYTFGHDTDWGKSWQACGKWEARDWRQKKCERPAPVEEDDLKDLEA